MSTSRHINKICAAAIAVSLALTFWFMNGASLGIASSARNMGYENRLFDTSTVHTIDIVMDDWDGFIATCESEEYSPCTVVIDGEIYKNIGIRAKGNTSLSSVRSMDSERYSFKLEFDQYETGKTYYGLDKLSLNNLIQDNTMMKDYLVYRMMTDFGVDSPLCSYVYITVNGEDWGLYLAVEGVEDGFLQRNYGSEVGELYKPDSMSLGGGRGNGRDFNFDEFDFSESPGGQAGETWQDGSGGFPEPPGGQAGGTWQAGSGGFPEPPGGQAGETWQAGSGGFPEPPGGQAGETWQDGSGGFPEPPGGQRGNIPQDGSGDGFPEPPENQGGTVPQGQGGPTEGSEATGEQTGEERVFPGIPGGFGGFGGMGSEDVKLKYIDDDPESYSNIFDNVKTDITNADRQRLISSLKSLNEYADLENVLDTDEVLRYFVVHNFVCNGDSYTGAIIHNYYLHEKDGRLSMIPWDYNLAFGTFQAGDADSSVNASIDSPVSGGSVDDRPMLGWIFSSEDYTQAYHELFSEFINRWFSDGQLARMIEETRALLTPYVEKDPTKFCTMEEFENGVETLEKFVALRAEAVDRQLSGDTEAVDATGLELSDMGSMGGGFGGAAPFPGSGEE